MGLPGAPLGLQAEDPTLADLLESLGYLTGQLKKITVDVSGKLIEDAEAQVRQVMARQ